MTELHIGITGSRESIRPEQVQTFNHTLESWHNAGFGITLHHGDCIGVDETLSAQALARGYKVVAHPPDIETHRAFASSHEVRSPKSYLVRNRDIVNESVVLLGFPSDGTEVVRSGTWSTIRYAWTALHRDCVWVIPPDGVPTKFVDRYRTEYSR